MTTRETTAPGVPAGQREPGRPADNARIWHAAHDDTSLAKLIRDYGQNWEIEHIDRGAEWLAYQPDDDGHITIITARDLHGLRFKLTQAQQHDAEEQGAN